jgi:hypothetical protein
MSDEDLELGNAIEADQTESIEEPKKRKVFSDRMAKVLMFVAIGIVALLVSITVSFLTYRFILYGMALRASGEATPTLRWPVFWLAYWMALCCGATVLVILHDLLRPSEELMTP